MKTDLRVGREKTGFEHFVDVVDGFIDRHTRVIKRASAIGAAAIVGITLADAAVVNPHFNSTSVRVVQPGESFNSIADSIAETCPKPDPLDQASGDIRIDIARMNGMNPTDLSQLSNLSEGQQLTVPSGECHADSPFDFFGTL